MLVGSDCDYNMNHKKRGMAIIFNHEYFDNPKQLERRVGTNVDRDNLKRTFEGLGFEVTVYNDLKLEELKKIVAEG
jgi:caspase-like apoptosis-related cysteine protease